MDMRKTEKKREEDMKGKVTEREAALMWKKRRRGKREAREGDEV